MTVHLARVYTEPGPDDGRRVLADRLWPRGVRKGDPRVGVWLQDVAPSTELRRWYSHDPDRAAEFRDRYRAELETPGPGADALAELRDIARQGTVTLVTSTREVDGSHLPVLAELLADDPGR
ncbi:MULTISPECIES: DUF488 domain-containing protein [unclassified Isoptericola]|uniref:DUF488 domain-containing protein n=1 Tax=unclassified Isoptericola TaxID=2623355 RepID=UPI002712A80B|nr:MULTISPECIES: DUF488 family protein [unclassified Isoptericola]MDO8145440.1 DUF488 family protein [Isoptericola sp. 178]MDO8149081.1 DUF488 family protein [Isoptericola sp. b515]MDO8150979.1 DUF488 family protein [Isoptericola sp. b408]